MNNNQYTVLFGPVISSRNSCVATLIGDSNIVRVGKKLVDKKGNILTILSIGTQCGGMQMNKTNVLLSMPADRSNAQYIMTD